MFIIGIKTPFSKTLVLLHYYYKYFLVVVRIYKQLLY